MPSTELDGPVGQLSKDSAVRVQVTAGASERRRDDPGRVCGMRGDCKLDHELHHEPRDSVCSIAAGSLMPSAVLGTY